MSREGRGTRADVQRKQESTCPCGRWMTSLTALCQVLHWRWSST